MFPTLKNNGQAYKTCESCREKQCIRYAAKKAEKQCVKPVAKKPEVKKPQVKKPAAKKPVVKEETNEEFAASIKKDLDALNLTFDLKKDAEFWDEIGPKLFAKKSPAKKPVAKKSPAKKPVPVVESSSEEEEESSSEDDSDDDEDFGDDPSGFNFPRDKRTGMILAVW